MTSKDDLYQRYMAADRARREHTVTCTPETVCETGARLNETFSRLQDAYLARQRTKQR
ncbi:hypothetical protein OG819_55355 [Streptomyces sp. NBC_01549]|uniref:hypothetical protein n=1 Tax=Streptomyces sp. NBC_01549 TaxID=2975874 RepID=UPI002252CCD5|nr:hypothetical protein [Streptomyces sp. NBC_01549]MCX4598336.1 hypothetical protein [Streptomyces sp. NBC_01549]